MAEIVPLSRARWRSRSTVTPAWPTAIRPGAVVLPSWVISYVSAVPGGSRPPYALGYCERDNDAYVRWDAVSRDRDGFLAWMRRNVLDAAGRLA